VGKLDKKREPGEFACDCVHVISLTLHERVAPAVAMRSIASTALHPFVVINRKNLFVYRERSGKVFYLKLSTLTISQKSVVAIEVFGVCNAGPEITEQLHQLCESKLTFITLSIISNLLLR